MHWKNLRSDINSSLQLKRTPTSELLVNWFNNATSENSNNHPESISSSKYYDIDKMYNIKVPNKNKYLSLFHINECSFNKKLMTFNIF